MPQPNPLSSDVLEALSDIDEMSRRRPEVLGFFSVSEAGRNSSCCRVSQALPQTEAGNQAGCPTALVAPWVQSM